MKKFFLPAVFAAFCLAACSNAGDTYVINNVVEDSSKTEKTYSIRVADLVQKVTDLRQYDAAAGKITVNCQIPLGIMAGKEDIPYVPIENGVLDNLSKEGFYKASDATADGTQVTVTNTVTGSKLVIDLLHRKFAFENYDAFYQWSLAYFDAAGLLNEPPDYMEMTYGANVAGKPLTLYWGGLQSIDIVLWRRDGKTVAALPLQTFSDIFAAPFNASLFYNGTYLYTNINAAPIAAEYYSAAPTGTRSQYLTDYCYDELCLNLDLNYGLKAIHGIDKFENFDAYFDFVGLSGPLKSKDCLTFSNAIWDICKFYFDDGHAEFMHNSWRLGKDVKVTGTKFSFADYEYYKNPAKYIAKGRNIKLGESSTDKVDPVLCYQRIPDASGDTVIVRFDYFTSNNSKKADLEKDLENFNVETEKYAGDKDMEDGIVTVAMIHAVNKKIKAAGDGVKNVVLDLSCNGGGSCRTAAFVLAWMLGEASLNFSNPITGSKCTATYKADVNFNGSYDDSDTIKDKNLFCIISPLSFSCGNMVPAMLKASGNVTILGATSSGGTCTVQPSCAADGTVFSFSSNRVMCAIKNGSAYDIDRGVEPHYAINEPLNFYDMTKIAQLVHDINDAKLGN